jgi:hypothetical protein
MPVPRDRSKDLDQARSLLAGALSNENDPEALAKFKLLRKGIAKHGFTLSELVTSPDGKTMSLADLMAAGDKVKEVVGSVRAAIVDPDVQKGVTSLVDLFKSGQEVVKKVRGKR